MLHTINNDRLCVTVNSHGAELWSITDRDTEYLWQGDKTFWADRSPNLFPYIGRMIEKKYTYKGVSYPMEIHGIALYSDFELVEQTESKLVFGLSSNTESLTQYPWEYCFKVIYTLQGNKLEVTYEVTNNSDSTMLFAVGGHPGFNIPLEAGRSYEDYRLRFSHKTVPQRILFTSDCFVDGLAAYPLENDDTIPLRHDLFDEDAIVLKTDAKAVTLECIHGGKSVTVAYPQMDYIGFWHMPFKDCPYVCIEPWSSLPSPKGEKTVLDRQKDLLQIEAGEIHKNTWYIEIA